MLFGKKLGKFTLQRSPTNLLIEYYYISDTELITLESRQHKLEAEINDKFLHGKRCGYICYSFVVNSMIRDYHMYNEICRCWKRTQLQKRLENLKDPPFMAVTKLIKGENTIIGKISLTITSIQT